LAVHRLVTELAADVPGGMCVPSAERFGAAMFERPGYIADGIIVAMHGQRWIGLTIVTLARDSLLTDFTGVVREYRGHKIAEALMVLRAQCGARHHVSFLDATCDAANAPVVAITKRWNAAGSGWYTLARRGADASRRPGPEPAGEVRS
jgi:hypothetical protein